jgi:ubiquinone/menaquinone biosynthesis C-methylase UbiE
MIRLNFIHWAIRQLWQTCVRPTITLPCPSILDIGGGSGIWAKEVAEAVPEGRVITVDLSPTKFRPGDVRPSNLELHVSTLIESKLTISGQRCESGTPLP